MIGCGGSSEKVAAGNSEKAITITTTAETGSLDPAGVSSYTYWSYQTYALDELVSYDKEGKPIYKAAESYDVNDDNSIFTFQLRKDAKWSDGTPVTAGDFINTITRALSPTCGSGYSDFLFCIKNAEEIYKGNATADTLGVKAVDDYTLEFDLKESCPYFIDLLRLPVFKPSCSKYATETGSGWDKKPDTSVGNGPYNLIEYVPQQYFVLGKNPNYWNKDKINLDKITFKMINDQQAQVNAYKTKEVDVATDLPYYIKDQYNGKEDFVTSPLITTKYLYPNITVKPLDDAKVRQAINLAINREEVCKAVGSNTVPTTNFVAKNMISKISGKKWVEETDPLFEEDVAKAQQLLAEAGYPNGEGFPKIQYMYPNVEIDSDTAQSVQAQLKKNLNIDVELVAQEMQVNIADRREHKFGLCRMSWTADFSDPYTYLSMHISNSSYNDNCVNDPEFDKLMAQSNTEKDPAKRNEILHQAEQELIGKQFYLVPLYSLEAYNLINPKITGYSYIPANGALDFTYADIK
ncbi:MAG TPA: peptide ABC transporter substrate-binding protein [Clostridium sp.]|nr:peptide ABC transporter substrate-binding protein [Clostridium sp.]